jgi:arylsulfatase A-like enzyme
VLTFSFPGLEREFEVVEELRLAFPEGSGGVSLRRVTLVHEPETSWFPDPSAPPQLVLVGRDARDSIVVRSGVPMSGGLRAATGYELRFSYCLPKAFQGLGGDPRLMIELDGARGSEVHRLSPRPGWTTARIQLDALVASSPTQLSWRASVATESAEPQLILLAEPRVVRPEERPPTVLLITSDTHRGDHVGLAVGAAPVSTPALDALAQRGVFFEDALSTTNITIPSHVALLTGVHPRDTGIVDNVAFLSAEAETLAEVFRAHGFRTFGAVSASHLGELRAGIAQGFERFSGPIGIQRSADQTTSTLTRWLNDSSDEPVFAWLHLFDAHGPYAPPAGFEDDSPVEGFADDHPNSANIRGYRGEVNYVDSELGTLLESARLREAVVAVTADHGEVLGNHTIWFQHERLYMDTVHVPLILSWPRGPEGVRIHERVQHLDLGRTLLDLAGLKAARFPGENLLAPGVASDQRPLYSLAARAESAAITYGNWHLILNLKRHRSGNLENDISLRERHQVELYDLSIDPGCRIDRIANNRKVASRLWQGLIAWLRDVEDRGWSEDHLPDAETLAQLEALGYTGGSTELGESLIEEDCSCDWCERWR